MSALVSLTQKLAERLDMGDGANLVQTLKATAFKGNVSDAQLTALMVVANQYGLNPWTKEIYAFPDRQNGIVPVVGVDGWARIINSHPQFDGMDFDQDAESCTCTIYRKDRTHPIKVTEWMEECRRANVGPWQSHPRRMLRHKAMIQCARLAFGFGGIYEPDEAERIAEAQEPAAKTVPAAERVPNEKPPYSDADFQKNAVKWQQAFDAGRTTPTALIATINAKYQLSAEQVEAINALAPIEHNSEHAA